MKYNSLHFWLGWALLWPVVVVAAEPDWAPYAALLQRHVTAQTVKNTPINAVNYGQLKKDPQFATVVAQIAEYPESALTSLPEKLAFYINAYNILAMKVVLDHWPVKSIKDGGGLLTPVWKIKAGTVSGQTITLDRLEHKIIGPLGEPRIHFAIVCASVSCPDLRMEPYTASQLSQQLDDQTRAFLNNPVKGVRLEGKVAHISRIFDWFGQDFVEAGGVQAFVRRYHPLPADVEMESNIDYDWSLNGQ